MEKGEDDERDSKDIKEEKYGEEENQREEGVEVNVKVERDIEKKLGEDIIN